MVGSLYDVQPAVKQLTALGSNLVETCACTSKFQGQCCLKNHSWILCQILCTIPVCTLFGSMLTRMKDCWSLWPHKFEVLFAVCSDQSNWHGCRHLILNHLLRPLIEVVGSQEQSNHEGVFCAPGERFHSPCHCHKSSHTTVAFLMLRVRRNISNMLEKIITKVRLMIFARNTSWSLVLQMNKLAVVMRCGFYHIYQSVAHLESF